MAKGQAHSVCNKLKVAEQIFLKSQALAADIEIGNH